VASHTPKPDHAKAIQEFFLGDATLFYSFLEVCCLQFPADMATGDQACTSSNWVQLRMQAHNLKSILQTLGYPELHAQARALELSCIANDADQSPKIWAAVRSGLCDILTSTRPSEQA
jgi:HPt (histidine-containing phosphotransfer) domain-containing protein